MGAPAAGSGPGAAGPAARAARAPGGCSRASGSSTSNRSRSARAPWRCTTPSRSSRTASPSTARSSSSARTTSSANTPSASLSGHILSGAGPGRPGGGCPGRGRGDRARGPASAPRRVWEGRLGPARAGRVSAAPSGHLPGARRRARSGERHPGRTWRGGGGAGLRGPSPPAAGTCVRARVRSRRRRRERGGRWAEPPAPGHVPSLSGPDAWRAGGEGKPEPVGAGPRGRGPRAWQQVRRVCGQSVIPAPRVRAGLSGHACSRACVGTCGDVCRWAGARLRGPLSSRSRGRTAPSLGGAGPGGAVRGADGRRAGPECRRQCLPRPGLAAEGAGVPLGSRSGPLEAPWPPPLPLAPPGRSLTHALPSST